MRLPVEHGIRMAAFGRLLPVAKGKNRPRLCKNAANDGNQLPGDFLSVQKAAGGTNQAYSVIPGCVAL